MKLKKVGSNMTQLTTSNYIVLFSYDTTVAYEDKGTGMCYKTSQKWSRTTSKHISKWLGGRIASDVSQDVLDGLVKG